MLVRGVRPLALLAGPLVVVLYICAAWFTPRSRVRDWAWSAVAGHEELSGGGSGVISAIPPAWVPGADALPPSPGTHGEVFSAQPTTPGPGPEPGLEELSGGGSGVISASPPAWVPGTDGLPPSPGTHREVFSASRLDGRYWDIRLDPWEGFSPNIIPHRTLPDTWIVVAQRRRAEIDDTLLNVELVCNGVFRGDAVECTRAPISLPIAHTMTDKCNEHFSPIMLNSGPHDARVFYGRDKPYVIYGSNSGYTCFGQFIQDLRPLIDWGLDLTYTETFRLGVELTRPPPVGQLEKNYFVFWDRAGDMYVHYDIAPTRVFTRLNQSDGSPAGDDLAPRTAEADGWCLDRYMPKMGLRAQELPGAEESIHQATNSLAVTLCRRADPSCSPDDSNTFVFSIVQFKTFNDDHSTYEPYVMAFRQAAPFALYGISEKPFWIHGRQRYPDERLSDMFYVTSISWKTHGQTYHGYLDDVVFVAFGIEDRAAGVIDIRAKDLLDGLGLC